jgi:phytoene/squalene synthetase
MNPFLQFSAKLYQGLLLLYPEDLRSEYGPEMALVFTEDLAEAWRHSRLAGVLRVWRCALSESAGMVVHCQSANPYIAVPAAAFFVTAAMLTFELSLALRHAPAIVLEERRWVRALGAIILEPSLVTALIAWAVVRLSKSTTTIALANFSQREAPRESPREPQL